MSLSSQRLARSLTSLSPPPSARLVSSLAPPYAHSTTEPSASLLPPYSHKVDSDSTHAPSTSLSAHHRFFLQRASIPPTGASKVSLHPRIQSLLLSDVGRNELTDLWKATVLNLESSRSRGIQVPQVSFISLSQQVKEESLVRTFLETGVLVVRDVVRDEDVHTWTEQLSEALKERQGRRLNLVVTFWDKSLLSARSHPSVLSANAQMMSAVSGTETEPYILASAAREGIGQSQTSIDVREPWKVEATKSALPSTPLSAQLALTRSSDSVSTVLPSISAAIYATLRPLFVPRRSLLSFYDKSAYLDPANWTLSTTSSAESSDTSLPHLIDSAVPMPQLEPGDILYHHTGLPVHTSFSQVFLPISPLPRDVNTEYVAHQLEAFERGLPPPGQQAQDLVELEMEGSRRDIKTGGGRTAMGYD
ncbi:hypothetical protein BD324DRAFT_609339 [Kockovaella imperatae]|uniref:Uncharacterized protein n=1 Tax=Kockovaella imperatae TaxID=4999 RepID=A0A1Y1UC02_9TREE|nr:hypothetical protein BD324DRAFT_609339 [Kockovaella imperatae]ORX35549.1 hypothetical protein BD324DRAFT_609339 [Kockovaella imperatae]